MGTEPLQQITVQSFGRTEQQVILCPEKTDLLNVLVQSGYRLPSPCGGMGRCGKCRVQIENGKNPVTAKEEAYFSREELEKGWRLACCVVPQSGMKVSVPEEREHQIVETGVVAAGKEAETGNLLLRSEEMQKVHGQENKVFGYVVAIDIGTTTLVFQLLNTQRKEVLHTVSMLNGQRRFGADVISRIQTATAGNLQELTKDIRADLKTGMKRLLAESGVPGKKIDHVAIGANTTMVHLLLGYDCSGLGAFPFHPVSLSMQKRNWRELVGPEEECRAETFIFPGISAFVGGDIVSGLYACGFEEKENLSLLIDLGTNGEIVLGNKKRLLSTSMAAGPAFEGGNISWGTGSVAGAVCGAQFCDGVMKVRTLWEDTPVGICGTGVIEVMAELLGQGLVDETGLLAEEYFETGFPVAKTSEGKEIVFTQGDIRELQLAKAAVRAGIEVLLKRYGVTGEEVAEVYVAGGFGYGLDKDKAIAIGMLPEEFREKLIVVGNSCIAGLGRFLTETDGEQKICRLTENAEEVNLALDSEFQEYYLTYLGF